MKQTDLFDAPVETGANQTPAVTTNQDDRAPFFDNADSLLQATMVQITPERAKQLIESQSRKIYQLSDTGEPVQVKAAELVRTDACYGYAIF